MDQSTTDTDPKLKEAYDRVMGNLTVPSPQDTASSVTPVTSPTTPPVAPITSPTTPPVAPITSPTTPESLSSQPPDPNIASTPQIDSSPDTSSQVTPEVSPSTSSPILDNTISSPFIATPPVDSVPSSTMPMTVDPLPQPEPIQPASIAFSGGVPPKPQVKKGSIILPFIIIGLVVFFGAYTLLWMKILSIPPFA